MRRFALGLIAPLFILALGSGTVLAGGPPHIGFYVDDAAYRTVGTPTDFSGTGAPAHSYDRIFVLGPNPAGGDLMNVAEAKPGDRDFNGGRWMVTPVSWDHVAPFPATNADVLIALEEDGLISFGAPVKYFECPVIKVPASQR
jgi:hypothetical protein